MDDARVAEPTRSTWLTSPGLLPYAIPALAAIVLSLPCFGFTYQWDDYDFLTNALLNRMGDLLPDPADPFYRPISRGIYFLVLSLTGSAGPVLGHVMNAIILVGAIAMVVRLGSRMAGLTAGFLAGLVFAGLGALPTLVGWVCCDQDLLSMLFALIALDLMWSRRLLLALIATAGALLSKETAIALVPTLILLDWILGRRPYWIARNVASYGLLVAAWAAIHPAVRTLLSRGLGSGATGYVGLQQPELWSAHFGKYILAMTNTLFTIPPPGWPTYLTAPLLVAIGISAWAIRYFVRNGGDASAGAPLAPGRVIVFGCSLILGPLILTSVMLETWAPYYSVYPAIGVALLAGIGLSRATLPLRIILIAVFFLLGVWSRGNDLNPRIPTEKNFRSTSRALRRVEANFRQLISGFPPGSQVLLSVQARGTAGVYTHMYTFGALRVWYAQPTIHTRRPEYRVQSPAPEFLLAITPDLDVIEIDPTTLAVRSASGRDPDYAYVEAAVRAYCTGLFGSGETDRAVGILLHMPEISARLKSLHWRIGATYLMVDGRTAEADSILSRALPLERGLALADLRAVLAEPPRGKDMDDAALRAFSIKPDDADAMRTLMRWFAEMKYAEPAIRFAERLARLRPGDGEAAQVTSRMKRLLEEKKQAPTAPGEL